MKIEKVFSTFKLFPKYKYLSHQGMQDVMSLPIYSALAAKRRVLRTQPVYASTLLPPFTIS